MQTPENSSPDFHETADSRVSALYSGLENITEPQSLRVVQQKLEEQVFDDPEIQEVSALRSKLDNLYDKFEKAIDKSALWDQIQDAQDVMTDKYGEASRRYDDLGGRIRLMEKYGVATIDKGDERLAFLEHDAPENIRNAEHRTTIIEPGTDNLDKDRVASRLAQLDFTRVEDIDNWRWSYGKDSGHIRAITTDKDPFMVPEELVVSAEGFDSWSGRGHNGSASKDTHKSSLDAIIDYASRETDIPPVGDAICYVQPDGKYFFKSGNAHRTAAFKARGVSHIPVTEVNISLLTKNVI